MGIEILLLFTLLVTGVMICLELGPVFTPSLMAAKDANNYIDG